jgi:hypothetical protein
MTPNEVKHKLPQKDGYCAACDLQVHPCEELTNEFMVRRLDRFDTAGLFGEVRFIEEIMRTQRDILTAVMVCCSE